MNMFEDLISWQEKGIKSRGIIFVQLLLSFRVFFFSGTSFFFLKNRDTRSKNERKTSWKRKRITIDFWGEKKRSSIIAHSCVFFGSSSLSLLLFLSLVIRVLESDTDSLFHGFFLPPNHSLFYLITPEKKETPHTAIMLAKNEALLFLYNNDHNKPAKLRFLHMICVFRVCVCGSFCDFDERASYTWYFRFWFMSLLPPTITQW